MLIAGDDGKPRDISFLGRSFAIDVENGIHGLASHLRGHARLEAFRDRRRHAAFARSELQARVLDLVLCAEVAREPGSLRDVRVNCRASVVLRAALQRGRAAVSAKALSRSSRSSEAKATKIGKGKSREIEVRDHQVDPASCRDHRGVDEAEVGERPAQQQAQPARHCGGETTISMTKASRPSPRKSRRRSKSEKTTTEKSKGRGKKAQPNSRISPTSSMTKSRSAEALTRGRSPSLELRPHPAGQARRIAWLAV